MQATRTWDIFCKVIDNFGDIGVCWRLCCNLAERGQQVRLWVNDASALAWMTPLGCPGVQVFPWPETTRDTAPDSTKSPIEDAFNDVVVEAFGCDAPAQWVRRPVWINLEYLSAEPVVERNHGLLSPVLHGPAKGLDKWFFYPGFTSCTGGLLREQNLQARQDSFNTNAWRTSHSTGPDSTAPVAATAMAWHISLFCYEPSALTDFLQHCATGSQHIELHITSGRAQIAVKAILEHKNSLKPLLNMPEQLSFSYHSPLSQDEYDHLLWACDINFVRGEDSLVRGLWAGKPLVWHIYPQDDGAHAAKLDAFLDWLDAPASLREFHHVWNGLSRQPLPRITATMLQDWGVCIQTARARLWAQSDMVTQLLDFVDKKSSLEGCPH